MSAVSTAMATFLFTNIEGGRHSYEADSDEARLAFAQYDRIVNETICKERGQVFKKGIGTFKAVFDDPDRAVCAALNIRLSLQTIGRPAAANTLSERTRIAVHSGIPDRYENIVSGPAVFRCSALADAAHGGQVVVSDETCALLRDALPPGASVRDLGIHGLGDTRAPIRVWQVCHPKLPDQFPSLNTRDLSATNIVVYSHSFVGRRGEIARVRALLKSHRLVTLTGEPGIGKTSLAYEIGLAESGAYDHGVWNVALDAVQDGTHLVSEIAGAVGVRESPGHSLTDVLTTYLRDKCLMLILDGCDRLRPACAELVSALLLHCPSLTVLATGLTPLGCDLEQQHIVLPLSRPPAAPAVGQPAPTYALVRYEGVRLFLERTRSHRPEFELSPDSAPALCHLIDQVAGNPLAIQLAAAKAHNMSVNEIADDIAGRKRISHDQVSAAESVTPPCSLNQVLDWSFGHLGFPEKLLLLRASVFSGGWDLAEAEAICSDPPAHRVAASETHITPADVRGVLQNLIQHGLVDRIDSGPVPRFHLLRPVLNYCRGRRQQTREGSWIRARHCFYFHRLAMEAAGIEDFVQRTAAMERLERSRHNVRAALREALEQATLPSADGAVERSLSFAAATAPFWSARGSHSEGRAYLARALEMPGARDAGLPRAGALLAAGRLALREGLPEDAAASIEGALEIYGVLNDRRGAAECLLLLAEIASIGTRREFVAPNPGEHVSRTSALQMPGSPARRNGRQAAHMLCGGDLISIRRQTSHDRTAAAALETIGRSALDRGDLKAAHDCFVRCMKIWQDLRDNRRIASTLESMAILACLENRSVNAASLYVAARYLQREDDVLLTAQEWEDRGAMDAWIRKRVDSGALTELERRNGALQVNQVIAFACSPDPVEVQGGKPVASAVPTA